jgi:hypothetical protein
MCAAGALGEDETDHPADEQHERQPYEQRLARPPRTRDH